MIETGKRSELTRLAALAGMYVRTYSPGDGVTRYRFFARASDGSEPNDYFGPANGLHTALGFKEAMTYAQGAYDFRYAVSRNIYG